MSSWDEQFRSSPSYRADDLESPFLSAELFAGVTEAEWETRLVALEAESPFQYGARQGQPAVDHEEEDSLSLLGAAALP